VRHAHEAEPAPAVPPGICDGRVTNGQQSTDPNVADGGTPPETSRPDGIRTGGDTKPGRGCSTGTVEARPGAGEVHKQVWKMGEVATLSSAPPDARPGGRPGGGARSIPTDDKLRARRPYLNTLAAHQDVDSTPLLYIHRPILDKNFHNNHKSGGFTPEVTVICMGKGPSLTFPINFFPYKKSAEVSPKKFSCKFPSPQATNWLGLG
jgi:hypothetical protein